MNCAVDFIRRKARAFNSRKRTLARRAAVQRAQHMFGARFGHANPEVAAGDALEMMGLIEDHVVVRRQERRALRAQCEIAKEQRVIADQKIRVLHAPAR